jgi:hypothetical protein
VNATWPEAFSGDGGPEFSVTQENFVLEFGTESPAATTLVNPPEGDHR